MKKSTLLVIVLILAGLIVWGVNEGYIRFTTNKTERKIFKTYKKSVDKVKSLVGE
jgi:phosphoglycerate-specific signal transduction histidine kinase